MASSATHRSKGLRDDKDAREVHLEETPNAQGA
ncbi:MAG: hypothetical protein JWQ89_2304 [Devosia sp.]|nr:hypothetical protein [Devosia sp.]